MLRNVVIYLIVTMFIIACNKKIETVDVKENVNTDIASSNENLFPIDNIAENGAVIKNADIPEMDGQGIDSIKYIKIDNISNTSEKNKKIFFKAIYDNDTVTIDNLIKDGFDINTVNENGENAVYLSIALGNYDILQYLIDNNINLNSTSDLGISPFSQAIIEYNNDAVDILLTSDKVDMYHVWGDMWTGSPLYIACSRGNIYALNKMLEKGVNLNYDFSEYSAIPLIHYVLSNKSNIKNEVYKELIAFLVLNKLDINVKNRTGETPIMIALKNGDVEAFNALIVGGADTSLKDNENNTAFDYANKYKYKLTVPEEEYTKIINILKIDNSTK